MLRLLMLITLFITIEMVFSRSRLAFDSMKLFDRRNMMSYHNGPSNDIAYKRNNMLYKRFGSPVGLGRRGVVPKGTELWPDGVIPYDLSKITDEKDRAIILEGFKQLMEDTSATVDGEVVPCITLRERTPEDENYVVIQYGEGCSTNGLGLQPGNEAELTLGPGCFDTATVQHEIMHIIGFDHEMMRPDRDQYVTVYLDRIPDDWLDQYNKLGEGTTIDLLTPYDANSIMHYDVSYDKDNRPDIESKSDDKIKPSERLSPIDVREVRILYQCKG